MYASIKGKLLRSTSIDAIIETASGIAFKIAIPANVFGQLPQIGQEVRLHTSLIIRDNLHALYGFLCESEKNVFELLMDVSGVGPKIGLAIIGHLSLPELRHAIADGQVGILCRIPGIGKKGAERLILELKEKILAAIPPDPSAHMIRFTNDPNAQKIGDAMSALINLGYNQQTAQKAIQKTIDKNSHEVELAILITESLKYI